VLREHHQPSARKPGRDAARRFEAAPRQIDCEQDQVDASLHRGLHRCLRPARLRLHFKTGLAEEEAQADTGRRVGLREEHARPRARAFSGLNAE
jgi:hypothetical protein